MMSRVTHARAPFLLLQALDSSGADVISLLEKWDLQGASNLVLSPTSVVLVSIMSTEGATGQVWHGLLNGGEVAVKTLQLPHSGRLSGGDASSQSSGGENPLVASLKRELAVLLHVTQVRGRKCCL
jgi:hypothetical protein